MSETAEATKATNLRPIKVDRMLHMSIDVSDLDRSVKFYTEVLGCTVKGILPNRQQAFMGCGAGCDINLFAGGTEKQVDPPDFKGGASHHAFIVSNEEYDRAKQMLAARGIPMWGEHNRRKGVYLGRQFYFPDPDGNLLELIVYEGPGPGF